MEKDRDVFQSVYDAMIECSEQIGPASTIKEFELQVNTVQGTDQYNESVMAIEEFKRHHTFH